MEKNQFDQLRWTDVERGRARRFGIFDVQPVVRISPSGRRWTFVVVDTPDWVTIIPMLGDNLVHMVRQFRHGSKTVTLEFPSGVVNRGEAPAVAAGRELLEETGCTAASLIEIGSVNPNPAFIL